MSGARGAVLLGAAGALTVLVLSGLQRSRRRWLALGTMAAFVAVGLWLTPEAAEGVGERFAGDDTGEPAAGKVAAPVAKTPAAPALDLNALKEQLKETKAIGVFTKISLKNQVDDLLQQFRDHYQGKAKVTMTQLRRSYDLLMMKVLSLLQDADQKLASAIVSSRETIWGLLADPKKFATLQG